MQQSHHQQKVNFLNLVEKYPYRKGGLSFTLSLANTLKSLKGAYLSWPCITVENAPSFAQDMVNNGWYFPAKISKARTPSGLTKVLTKFITDFDKKSQ